MPKDHGWVEQAGEKRVDMTLTNALQSIRKFPPGEQKALFDLLWNAPTNQRDYLTKEAVKMYLQTGTIKGLKPLQPTKSED